MSAIIFALISYLGWGIGDIFGTIASRKIGGYSTTFPILFVVLAFLIFKDPITKQQIAGIITTLIGIVLLSVFSV